MTGNGKEPEDVLKEVVSSLVSQTERVRITKTTDEEGILFTIHTAPSEVGKIIGVRGGVIIAIRRLFRSIAREQGGRISIKVNQPQ